ncbi:MAG: caspase family protein [Pseudomonadota bacterium]
MAFQASWYQGKFRMRLVMISALALALCLPASSSGVTKSLERRGQVQETDATDVGAGDLYAVVVGVAKYSNPKIPRLTVSDKDARDFAEFLKTQKDVFKDTHVKVMLNEEATKTEVTKQLYYELRKAGKDDTVILFFSGHGADDPRKPGDFFFLTHEADPENLEGTAVKMNGLDFLQKLDANRVVLIADSCHAGGFSRNTTKALEPSIQAFMREFGRSSGRAILSSSKPDEYSVEKPGFENSVFTHFLIKGLKGEADGNRDGVVTLREAYDYVYDSTKDETNGVQHPQFEGKVVGSFPVSVLGKLDNPIELEVWFTAQDPRCTDPNCTDPAPGAPQCSNPLCGDVTIENGSTMYTGQNYQIGFRPSQRAYVYVFQQAASGEIYRLFPGKDFVAPDNKIENPLQPGKIHWIPAGDLWLRHDDHLGKEKIYVVASRSKNAKLENLYVALEESRKSGNGAGTKESGAGLKKNLERLMMPTKSLVRKVETRAKSEPVPASKEESFESFAQTISSESLDAVKSVWFRHESR